MKSEEALDASPFCTGSADPETADEGLEQQQQQQQRRLTFAKQFVSRLQRYGYVRLCGHGISADEISQAFQAHKVFFDLPADRKREVLYRRGATPARGFTPSHTERTFLHKPHLSQAAEDAAEPREQFTLGPPEDQAFPTPWFLLERGDHSDGDGDDDDGQAEQRLAKCHAVLLSFYNACRSVALQLVWAIELGLGLRRGTLTEHYLPDASELTLNWYPEASRAALLGSSLKRIWPHSDLGIISLLFQDGVGGLEFQDRDRRGGGSRSDSGDDDDDDDDKLLRHFVPVHPGRPEDAEMIVNSADTLERWTNGVISAGIHRVTAPAPAPAPSSSSSPSSSMIASARNAHAHVHGEGATDEIVPGRRSIVLLYRPKGKASMAPLPDFVTPDAPARFEEMTATEYLSFKNRLTFGDVEKATPT